MRMALVIFCVLRTDAMRLFISLREAKRIYYLTIYNLQFDVGGSLFDDGGDVVINLTFSKRCEHILLMSGANEVKEGCLKVT